MLDFGLFQIVGAGLTIIFGGIRYTSLNPPLRHSLKISETAPRSHLNEFNAETRIFYLVYQSLGLTYSLKMGAIICAAFLIVVFRVDFSWLKL